MPTTLAEIRSVVALAIEAQAPTVIPAERFRSYRGEGPGDFVDWAEANPTASWRRFNVRDMGVESEPAISDMGVEWREALIEILIAYPKSHRAGGQNALDRDDVMSADQTLLEDTIGPHGGATLQGVATFISDGYTVDRLLGEVCDFLLIQQRMGFYRGVS